VGAWRLAGGGLDDVPDEHDNSVPLSVARPFDGSVDIVVPPYACSLRVGVQPGSDGVAILTDEVGHDDGQVGAVRDGAVGDEALNRGGARRMRGRRPVSGRWSGAGP
jgi:hypothetical protein